MNDKPLSVTIQEARTAIVDAINRQPLHAAILRMILKEIYDEVCMLDNKIAVQEKSEYEESLKEETGE